MATHGARLTWSGAGWLGLALGIGGVAATTGNNTLFMVTAGLVALVVVDGVVGRWNLRGLTVLRHLPDEVYAGVEARGGIEIANGRSLLPSMAVHVDDVLGQTVIDAIGPRHTTTSPIAWWFPRRGTAHLEGVRLSSSFPFGMFERWRRVDLPAELVVYPEPRSRGRPPEQGGHGAEGVASESGDGVGDYAGLRAYRPGDPLRSVHWPTSGRAGRLIVVQRTADVAREMVVRVRPLQGDALERELSGATGEVRRGTRAGMRVRLELPSGVVIVGVGTPARRGMLEALAIEPGAAP